MSIQYGLIVAADHVASSATRQIGTDYGADLVEGKAEKRKTKPTPYKASRAMFRQAIILLTNR